MVWVCAPSRQSRPTLCNPMDCSPPGSSVHGVLQARMLEWVAMPFSRGSSWPRDWTRISYVSCADGFLTTSTTREALYNGLESTKWPGIYFISVCCLPPSLLVQPHCSLCSWNTHFLDCKLPEGMDLSVSFFAESSGTTPGTGVIGNQQMFVEGRFFHSAKKNILHKYFFMKDFFDNSSL